MKILIPRSILNSYNNKPNYSFYIEKIEDDLYKAYLYENNFLSFEKEYSLDEIFKKNLQVVSFLENYEKRLTKLIL